MDINKKKLLDGIKNKDIRSLSRLLTLLENKHPIAAEILDELYPLTGKSYIIGITGAPGAGKSTVVDKLVTKLRRDGDVFVGIIAVDPTSPFTGGAILGDRIRMQRHCTDPSVFIRSMATRMHLGGLAPTTIQAVNLFDAFGADYIIIETVGVGQDEVEVVELAMTTIVLLVPSMGDDIQSIKAGIMEIADIFVVNKADLTGVEKTIYELQSMLGISSVEKKPEIVKTKATLDEGFDDLCSAIKRHREYIKSEKLIGKKAWNMARNQIQNILIEKFLDIHIRAENKKVEFENLVTEVSERRMSPYKAAGYILRSNT
ncbi:methylmalonyl Co-A mutase-associated GTPase MeaB [bacterium]|nr:methylmalonyl Co-A mutase-associated GTPase MeaB [bacterium]